MDMDKLEINRKYYVGNGANREPDIVRLVEVAYNGRLSLLLLKKGGYNWSYDTYTKVGRFGGDIILLMKLIEN